MQGAVSAPASPEEHREGTRVLPQQGATRSCPHRKDPRWHELQRSRTKGRRRDGWGRTKKRGGEEGAGGYRWGFWPPLQSLQLDRGRVLHRCCSTKSPSTPSVSGETIARPQPSPPPAGDSTGRETQSGKGLGVPVRELSGGSMSETGHREPGSGFEGSRAAFCLASPTCHTQPPARSAPEHGHQGHPNAPARLNPRELGPGRDTERCQGPVLYL